MIFIKKNNMTTCAETRSGFAFNNPDIDSDYLAPAWGRLVTADELRYDEMFGNMLIAEADSQSITNDQLSDYERMAIRYFETELNVHILPRTIRYENLIGADGNEIVRTDIDDTALLAAMDRKQQSELYLREMGYPYRVIAARQECFIKLRWRPVRDVLTAVFVDPFFGSQILDLMPYRVVKKGFSGTCFFRPRQLTARMNTYQYVWQQYIFAPYMNDRQNIFLIDYTTGYENCQDVPDEFRNIIKKLAACTLMNIYGDGKLAAIASRSVSLNSVSESVNTTLSASVDKNSIVEIRNIKTKKIKKYRIGKLYKKNFDWLEYEVLSVNPKDITDIQYKQLIDVVEHIVPEKKKYWIKTKFGKIGVTEDHSLFKCKNKKLVEVKGSEIKEDGEISGMVDDVVKNIKVLSIKEYKAGKKVYDLSVKDFENFIVNGNIISHNTSATFGARIIQYQKEIKTWLAQNRSKYSRTLFGNL